jgi:hypothetical protein
VIFLIGILRQYPSPSALNVSEHIDNPLSPFVLSLSKYERTRQCFPKISLIPLSFGTFKKGVPGLFQSRPFDRLRANGLEKTLFDELPSTGSGQAGRTDWKRLFSGQTSSGFKNSLRTLFLSSALFFAICDEGVKNLSALSLLNHRQRLSPFVLVLPEHFDTLYPRSC